MEIKRDYDSGPADCSGSCAPCQGRIIEPHPGFRGEELPKPPAGARHAYHFGIEGMIVHTLRPEAIGGPLQITPSMPQRACGNAYGGGNTHGLSLFRCRRSKAVTWGIR